MKQKNVILMVVAVGCGLVAALLTSQMSAKPKAETVDVIVAAKDLPVGTMITKEDLPKILKTRKLPKDALPPVFVQTEDELVGKRLGRAVRVDETFNPMDLKVGGTVTLPPNMDMISVSVGLPEAVAGFVTPGSRVDVLATAKFGQRQLAFPLLVDMLVLAVDSNLELPKESASFQALNTVSFAVNREQALLLQLARTRGCQMSLVLRNTNKTPGKEVWTAEDVRQLLSTPDGATYDDIRSGNPLKQSGEEPSSNLPPRLMAKERPQTSDTVALPIAMVDLPAGTELTIDVIKDKFQFKNVPAPAPENAVLDIENLQGKVLQQGIAADQWLPKKFVGDYAPGKAPIKDEFLPSKPAPGDAPIPAPIATGPAKKTHDLSVVTTSGRRIFRYEEKKPGSDEWVLVGEVTKGGDPQAPQWAPAPGPAPAPSPEPKPEPVPSAQPRQD